jgi:hypothetical protein
MPALLAILGSRYVAYAAIVIVVIAGCLLWLREHDAALAERANAERLAQNVIESNLALEQLRERDREVRTVVQTVERKIYVYPKTQACSGVPAIRDALVAVDGLQSGRSRIPGDKPNAPDVPRATGGARQ